MLLNVILEGPQAGFHTHTYKKEKNWQKGTLGIKGQMGMCSSNPPPPTLCMSMLKWYSAVFLVFWAAGYFIWFNYFPSACVYFLLIAMTCFTCWKSCYHYITVLCTPRCESTVLVPSHYRFVICCSYTCVCTLPLAWQFSSKPVMYMYPLIRVYGAVLSWEAIYTVS